MEQINIRLAGHIIRVLYRYEKNRDFFADYITDDDTAPEIIASVTEEEIRHTVAEVPGISPETAELTSLYRPIAEALPHLGGFVFHGAAISFGGKGYIFTAPSGTGKSTHIKLWRKHLGNKVDIINGDKPIITVSDGGVFVHGTPWAGKERWQKNCSFPLGGICLLRRSISCKAEEADTDDDLPFLLSQTYISPDADVTGKTMELLDKVIRSVKISRLYCDISEEAVRCSFEEMCSLCYDDHKLR